VVRCGASQQRVHHADGSCRGAGNLPAVGFFVGWAAVQYSVQRAKAQRADVVSARACIRKGDAVAHASPESGGDGLSCGLYGRATRKRRSRSPAIGTARQSVAFSGMVPEKRFALFLRSRYAYGFESDRVGQYGVSGQSLAHGAAGRSTILRPRCRRRAVLERSA
jgi:hypothetical protein